MLGSVKNTIFALSATWALSGCGASMESKMSVKVASGKPKPAQIKNGIIRGKSWFQTREMVTMSLTKDALQLGDVYSIINETTNITLIDKQIVGVNIAGDDDGVLSLGGNYEIQVRFYPKMMSDYEDFTYGTNTVKLLVEDKKKPVFQKDQLIVSDFETMGIATIGFDDNIQQSNGYQSWLNNTTTINGLAYSRTVDTTLTAGYFNLINPSDN